MTHSIYHFFRSLSHQKHFFKKIKKLDKLHFDKKLLSCRNDGVFPDMAIRLNKDRKIFTGGELIELKDSDSYTVASFNSTIPARSKKIEDIITGKNSTVKKQMEKAGNEISSLPVRDVYYLIRGRKNEHTKVCLVYGSFFETISVGSLISNSFSQVLDERLREGRKEISEDLRQTLISLLSQQQNFSKVRNVEKASVKLRFRIMTEVKSEGNILNTNKYPEIRDDTLNFVLSCHDDEQKKDALDKLKLVFNPKEMNGFSIFTIKHHFNGHFLVIQTPL